MPEEMLNYLAKRLKEAGNSCAVRSDAFPLWNGDRWYYQRGLTAAYSDTFEEAIRAEMAADDLDDEPLCVNHAPNSKNCGKCDFCGKL